MHWDNLYTYGSDTQYNEMINRDKGCTDEMAKVRAAHLLVRRVANKQHEGRHVIWLHLDSEVALRLYVNHEGRLTGKERYAGINARTFDSDIEFISRGIKGVDRLKQALLDISEEITVIGPGADGLYLSRAHDPSLLLIWKDNCATMKNTTTSEETLFYISKKEYLEILGWFMEKLMEMKLKVQSPAQNAKDPCST